MPIVKTQFPLRSYPIYIIDVPSQKHDVCMNNMDKIIYEKDTKNYIGKKDSDSK